MSKIEKIIARQVIDSRGNPTVEADVISTSGSMGRAIVPSGASTGSQEALELRDENNQRYMGKEVMQAVENVNSVIFSEIKDFDITDQAGIDSEMCCLDGTDNKNNLGANAILAVSLAVAKAAASELKLPLYQYFAQLHNNTNELFLPVPQMNIINGGEHANNSIDFQEFMILPTGAPSFSEAMRYGVEVFHSLKKVLDKQNFSTAVGDEGGFAPDLASNEKAIETILEAIENAGYKPSKDIKIGLDIASTEIFDGTHYLLKSEGLKYTPSGFVNFLSSWTEKYPIATIEDGMDENDWQGWSELTKKLGKKIQLTGDDLFVTNPSILKKGIDLGVANSILIKFNQIGTLTETLKAIAMAQEAGYRVTVSHRSGETEDTTIADLAVGTGAEQIKTGSLCRSDRLAKYNQLLRIEQELGPKVNYLGNSAVPIF